MRKKPFGQTQIYSVYFVTEVTQTKLTNHITENEQWKKKDRKRKTNQRKNCRVKQAKNDSIPVIDNPFGVTVRRITP